MKELVVIPVALVLLAGCGECEREEWEVALIAHEWEQFYPPGRRASFSTGNRLLRGGLQQEGRRIAQRMASLFGESDQVSARGMRQMWEAQAKGAPWNEPELNLLTTKVDRLNKIYQYHKCALSAC